MSNNNWKKQNEKYINSYSEFKKITNRSNKGKIAKGTLNLYKKNLTYLSNNLKKPFKNATETDILKHLSKIISNRTKNNQIFTFQDFYRYIYRLDKNDRLPNCIRRLRQTKIIIDDKKYRELVITEGEYNQLINYAYNPMHKAIIEFLWTTGARKNSIEQAKAKDVKYDGEFTKIFIRDKKTGDRDFSHPNRMEHLLLWTESLQPYKNQENKPLFTTKYNSDKPVKIGKSYVYDTLERISKKAGLKHIKPHDFRHTRATIMFGSNDIKDTHAKTLLGFTKNTDMVKIYDHNTTSDYEEYIRKRKPKTKPTYKELEKKQDQIETLVDIVKAMRKALHSQGITIVMPDNTPNKLKPPEER